MWITIRVNIIWAKYFFLSPAHCPLSSSAELLASSDISFETHKSSTAQSKPHKVSKTSQCELLPSSHSAVNSSSSHLHASQLPTHWMPSFLLLFFHTNLKRRRRDFLTILSLGSAGSFSSPGLSWDSSSLLWNCLNSLGHERTLKSAYFQPFLIWEHVLPMPVSLLLPSMLLTWKETNTLAPESKALWKVLAFGSSFTLLQEHREVTVKQSLLVSGNSHIRLWHSPSTFFLCW